MEIICRNLKELLLNTCQDMAAYELPYIQSWPKILAPLHFFQIMHYFSQKMITNTNVLVFSYLFILFELEQHKKA